MKTGKKRVYCWCCECKAFTLHSAYQWDRVFVACLGGCWAPRMHHSLSYLEWLGVIKVTKDPKTFATVSVELV